MRSALVAFASLVLLSGCTDADWDHLTDFDKPAPQEVVAAAPAIAARPPDTAFCQAVAQQDATGGAFDAATQTRVAQTSYAQCMALYSK